MWRLRSDSRHLRGALGGMALAAITLASPAAEAGTFTYTSSTTYTVPAGVSYLTVTVVGPGGGGGGCDAGGGGAAGGAGERTTGQIPVAPGQTYTMTIGTGGGPGITETTCAGGGSPGTGATNGGVGGNAGCSGASGGGGGGGGSSAILLSGTVLAEAGGGGGGGGGSCCSAATAGIVGLTGGNTPRTSGSGAGSAGGSPGGSDGAGGGGGGAGVTGGAGGTGHFDGASDTVPASGGSGTTAASVLTPVRTAGGGAAGGPGCNGATNTGQTAGSNGSITIVEVGCLTAANCNDGIACTLDACTAGACTHSADPVGTVCPTGVCNGGTTAAACVQCLSSAQCAGVTPVCNTATSTCRACAVATQGTDCTGATTSCNARSGGCVAPSVVLTTPPANVTTTTTNNTEAFAGTGVPGQTVTVTANGATVCTATVSAGGIWTCTATLTLGSKAIVATSNGASSMAVLVVNCATSAQCSSGQACNVVTGACVTPACDGNSGSGSPSDCPSTTPVCSNPGTSSAACGTCLAPTVYNPVSDVCVVPSVALTAPPAGGSATTINTSFPFTGTGVPGQAVSVFENGTLVCTTTVTVGGTWTCTGSGPLPLGALAIVATSGVASSAGTLVVQCSLDSQCTSGQVCNTGTGVCVTPNCLGNSGSGSAADCPLATPVCSNPGTFNAACGACGAGLIYNTASFLCVAPAVALTSPPAGSTASTAVTTPTITGTGVPGQAVTVTVNGMMGCMATVDVTGAWSCMITTALPVGSNNVVATSAGATSNGTLVVLCTVDTQCSGGQVCNVGTGVCVSPSCLGNAGSGSGGDCPIGSPVCSNPDTSSAACGACTAGLVYNSTTFACVDPAVLLTTPPDSSSSSTTNLELPIQGTGVPGQTVAVTSNGTAVCTTTVASDGTWTCTPTSPLSLGADSVVATSAGAISTGTLNVQCTLDAQCSGGQVCNVGSGVCVTPSCLGNAGSGSAADCTLSNPVCAAPGTSSATCVDCAAGQVYNTTTFACVSPAVTLTSPAEGTTVNTTNVRDPISGTGVPGTTVSVTADGSAVCTTVVAADGTWTCTPSSDLTVGSLIITATSAGATSTATLIVQCTSNTQCITGQACDVPSGACVTPSCVGNAGSGSAADCPLDSPVCSNPGTSTATCGVCTGGQVFDTNAHACAAAAVALTSPPAGGTSNTTAVRPSITGTGVPGQTVTVSVGGATVCTALVGADGTWNCAPMTDLPIGSNTVTASSGGVMSMGTLVVQCTLDTQCGTGQVCTVASGACTTPSCRGNAGSGSAADCPAATPVCTGAGTSTATCGVCATGQVYNTATFLCVPGAVALTSPPAGGMSTTTNPMPVITGTGVPGQSVTVTNGTTVVCTAQVHTDGTWTCTSTVSLPLGSDTITATSAGATSMGTLVVHCAANGQCSGTSPVCDTTTGACVGCLMDSQCATGMFCDTSTDTCHATLPNGQSCTRAVQCMSGVCSGGSCVSGGTDAGTDSGHDAGTDTGVDAGHPADASGVNVTGGGACSCRTAGSTSPSRGGLGAGIGFVLLALSRRRSRRRAA